MLSPILLQESNRSGTGDSFSPPIDTEDTFAPEMSKQASIFSKSKYVGV